MNSYFPLVGLGMAFLFAIGMMKFNDFLVRRGLEDEERQRKESEAKQDQPH